MNNWLVRVFLAWVAYLACIVCKDFVLRYCIQLFTGWSFLPGYSLFCAAEVWQQVRYANQVLPWCHGIGCGLLGYITLLSFLIEVDYGCRGALATGCVKFQALSVPDFRHFSRLLYTRFQASAAPFVFVDNADVFCLVSYSDFCGYPLWRQLSIVCHVLMPRLPLSISEYTIAHEAAHIYYADVLFRWWLDVIGLFLFFMLVFDVSSAVVYLGLLVYCRQSFARAQEIWADFTALTSYPLCAQNGAESISDISIESLCYVVSFDEACYRSCGIGTAIRSCVYAHPQGWLRLAVQLFFLRILHYPVVRSPHLFSWVHSETRRASCHMLLQHASSVNTCFTGLLVLYLVLQAPFLCMVALQRLCVIGFGFLVSQPD